jgi:hypothetical protein
MRRIMSLLVLGLLVGGCSLNSLTNGINGLNRTASGFAPTIEMKQLDPWGHFVPCNGSWYDIHDHRAALRFYPGPDARVVSIEATFDDQPLGVDGYVIPLPHLRDRQHELRIVMILKPKAGEPFEKRWTMTLDYHED